MTIDLYKGDCVEIMRNLISEGVMVDSVICDPPYEMIGCEWDKKIPFDVMWFCLDKLVKPSGAIVLFGSEPFASYLRLSNINNFREDLIWLKNKPASGFNYKQKHMKVHENILVFSNSSCYTFNPQKWLVSDKSFMTQRKTFGVSEVGNNIYGKITRVRKEDTGERNPISILSCRVPFTPQKSKTYKDTVDLRFHPTQKPIELMRYLVETYSNKNDTVLDFTMGSGTTGVACKELNRNFIGIEIDNEFYKIAEDRINNSKEKAVVTKKKGLI